MMASRCGQNSHQRDDALQTLLHGRGWVQKLCHTMLFLAFSFVASPGVSYGQAAPFPRSTSPIWVDVGDVLRNRDRLVQEEDTDDDSRITVTDTYVWGREHANKQFWLHGAKGKQYEVVGIYYLPARPKLISNRSLLILSNGLQRLFAIFTLTSQDPLG
jgi:hypothetical protein